MHYDYIAIPDEEIPRAVEPIFQHVVTTYVSEANNCCPRPARSAAAPCCNECQAQAIPIGWLVPPVGCIALIVALIAAQS